MLDAAAARGVDEAIRRMQANIEKGTQARDDDMPCMEDETNMAKRIKQRVQVNGETKWVTGSTMQEVIEAAARLMVEAEQQHMPALDCPMFKPYAEKWFDLYNSRKTKRTTQTGYKSYLRKHLYPAFGDMPMNAITVDMVQGFLNSRQHMARKSVKNILMVLVMVLDAAKDDGYIRINPASNRRIVIPTDKATVRDALERDDVRDIVHSIGTLAPHDQLFAGLLMFTAMRRGEILGLQWDDVDFDAGLIHVRRNATYPSTNQAVLTTPKSRSGRRDVPILPQLMPILAENIGAGYVIGNGDKIGRAHV